MQADQARVRVLVGHEERLSHRNARALQGGMCQCLRGGDTLSGVVAEALQDQVVLLVARVADDASELVLSAQHER